MFQSREPCNYYLKAFILSLLTGALIILPFVIEGRGILYIFSDFNLQQIPFNMLSNEAIKSGDVFWNWNTDLGSNFIGSYSFYTLGSPFFWLTMLFSANIFPYLIGPLLILKLGVAGLASFAFIQRFVKNKNYAVIGSLIYAFSGFQIGNLFYNHFLDVTALFPLLLIALEEFLTNDRKGFLAVTVALSAFVNFEFFVGEVVFLLIYFIFWLTSKEFRMPVKKWCLMIFESILGVGISFVLLLPSALFTREIPRAVSFITGFKAIFYHPSVYLDIFKALLMPPEAVNRSVISATSWTSTEAYLPLFGMILVLSYVLTKKKDWLSLSIIACMVFAFVPVLNSVFYLFNGEYYSRWFYMPVLLMALASSKALDDEDIRLKRGVLATAVLWVVFLCGLAVASRFQTVIINSGYLIFMALLVGVSFISFGLIMRIKGKRYFFNVAAAAIIVLVAVSGIFNIWADQKNFPDAQVFTKIYTDAAKTVSLPDNDNYRIDTTDCYFNTNILLGKPSIDFFSSTVDGSITSFYNSLGIDRVNNSSPAFSLYALRPFLSVKYVVALNQQGLPSVTYQDYSKLPSLSLYKKSGSYDIYENNDYIPLGFTFDNYVSNQSFDSYSSENRQLILLKALVLNRQQIQKYSDILTAIPNDQLNNFTKAAYSSDVKKRNAQSCYYFDRYNTGFTAKINLTRDNLVFFSVPFDKGWSATVNGRTAAIEDVDSGFMAVKGSSGGNTIVFTFKPQGLGIGLIVTIISCAVLLAYMGILLSFKLKMPRGRR